MAPQVVNMQLLLSSADLAPHPHLPSLRAKDETHMKDTGISPVHLKYNLRSDRSRSSDSLVEISKTSPPENSRRSHSRRKSNTKRRYSPVSTTTTMIEDPLNFIQKLLFPVGQSMAYCNEETLSSSFLILDGYMTISLGDDTTAANATQRWGKRLETNICVGKVAYEYRESDEVEKSMSHSSEEEDEFGVGDGNNSINTSNRASILSQYLEKIPLVLDQEPDDSGTLLDPDRYLPPTHKMVADALKFQEYDQAVEVYEDILEADKERYGESDLVCAIDYHNLGVASLLANDLDSALYYFQEAVVLKRTLLGQNDPTVSDSLVEIGIILYNRNDAQGALRIFNEALDIYRDANISEGVGRASNNIGCVYFQMGNIASALEYLQEAMVAQRMELGMSEKAESSLLSFAITQSNVGYLKMKSGHLDANAMLEESLLVLESVLGDEESDMTVQRVRSNLAFLKKKHEAGL